VSFIEVALQRLKGWRECRMPPLGDPCDLSWSSAALRGLEPGRPGRILVPVRPVRRFDALRVIVFRTASRPEGRGLAPLALSCSFRDMSLQPRTAASIRTTLASRRKTRPAMQPLLGLVALRHSPGPADPLIDATDPSVHRVPRAGFGYPLRDVHHRSSRRAKRRSVHGLDPPRCSPRARAVPLPGSLPS
jgi:hypothetical protein